MNIDIKGTLVKVNEVLQVTDSFKKRECLVLTSGKYPQTFKIEFVQDTCNLLDNYTEGQSVSIVCNLRGRAYQETAFNSIQGWKITTPETTPADIQTGGASKDFVDSTEEEADDLPF